MKVYGIDFTSAPKNKKPITCVECTLTDRLMHATDLVKFTNFKQFEEFLSKGNNWITGIDFPFGQPRKLIYNLGWPLSWEGYVKVVSQMDKQTFVSTLTMYCQAQPKGDKHHFRTTDEIAKSCSPMTLYGTPVGKMFFQGAPLLLNSGVNIIPCRPTNAKKIVIEAYPKLVAKKWIGKYGYKSDTKKKQSDKQKTARSNIMRGICSEELRDYYGFNLKLSEKLINTFIVDPSGDYLDALLCAIQAGWAYNQRENGYGIPANFDPIEGWIVDPELLSNTIQ